MEETARFYKLEGDLGLLFYGYGGGAVDYTQKGHRRQASR